MCVNIALYIYPPCKKESIHLPTVVSLFSLHFMHTYIFLYTVPFSDLPFYIILSPYVYIYSTALDPSSYNTYIRTKTCHYDKAYRRGTFRFSLAPKVHSTRRVASREEESIFLGLFSFTYIINDLCPPPEIILGVTSRRVQD